MAAPNHAQAQAVCQQYLEMNDILEYSLGIGNVVMRSRLLRLGFKDLEHLCRQNKGYAKRICATIKKLPGVEATKTIPEATEDLLGFVQQWCVCKYMVKRDLDALIVDEDTISPVGKWFSGLDKPKTKAKDPAKFSDSGDKKTWFDDITSYLEQVIGDAGVPISYVVREDDDPTADEGFGMPTFNKEMRYRGRHDGMFWVADNSTVYFFLYSLCHGTTAWGAIQGFERTENGRAAYNALKAMYLGLDQETLMQRRSEDWLHKAMFDGRKNGMSWPKFVNLFNGHRFDLARSGAAPATESQKSLQLLWMFNVSGLEYAKGNLFMNKTMFATPGACSAYLGTLMTEQRIANVGADGTARGISSFNQSNSWKKKDKTNPGHGKGKMKYVRKGEKKGSKYPPPAKKFDSKKPGQHLTKEAWMALTDDQKTASRDARRAVKEAKEAGTEISDIRTIRMITAARDGSFDASPAVATLKTCS